MDPCHVSCSPGSPGSGPPWPPSLSRYLPSRMSWPARKTATLAPWWSTPTSLPQLRLHHRQHWSPSSPPRRTPPRGIPSNPLPRWSLNKTMMTGMTTIGTKTTGTTMTMTTTGTTTMTTTNARAAGSRVSVRVQLLVGMILLAGLTLLIAGTVNYVLERKNLEARMDESLARDVEAISVLAASGLAPETPPPFPTA